MTDKFSRKAYNFNHVTQRGYYMYCLLEFENTSCVYKKLIFSIRTTPIRNNNNFLYCIG
jgi:hypothetical protein